jgi:hypothetical protein
MKNKTTIEIHPYASRVFTAIELDDITIELSHTEAHEVLDFIVIDNGLVWQE